LELLFGWRISFEKVSRRIPLLAESKLLALRTSRRERTNRAFDHHGQVFSAALCISGLTVVVVKVDSEWMVR
jgi:hypothetical protein